MKSIRASLLHPTAGDALRAGWKPAPLALLLLAAGLMLGQGVWFDRTCCATYDETFYLVWYREKPDSILRLLTLCAAIGVAISLQCSGVFLLPLAATRTVAIGLGNGRVYILKL